MLNEESLAGNVHLFRIAETGLVPVESAASVAAEDPEAPQARSTVLVTPAEPLEPGARYAVVVTKGVEDADGEPIAEPSPIFFAKSTEPLVDEDGVVQLSVLEDDLATAKRLEALRKGLRPLFDLLENRDTGAIERESVAMLFAFTVTTQPSVILDPDSATLPLPNTAALDADGTMPDAAFDSVAEKLEELRASDPELTLGEVCDRSFAAPQLYFDCYLARTHGWPTNLEATVPLTVPVDAATVTPESVQLWQIEPDGAAERVESVAINVRAADEESGDRIEIHLVDDDQAEAPRRRDFAPNTRYVALVTRDVADATGRSLLGAGAHCAECAALPGAAARRHDQRAVAGGRRGTPAASLGCRRCTSRCSRRCGRQA